MVIGIQSNNINSADIGRLEANLGNRELHDHDKQVKSTNVSCQSSSKNIMNVI